MQIISSAYCYNNIGLQKNLTLIKINKQISNCKTHVLYTYIIIISYLFF